MRESPHCLGGKDRKHTYRNLKDLEELLKSVKTLKRNNEESSEVLVGPSYFFSE
jgi:hypothetical protein